MYRYIHVYIFFSLTTNPLALRESSSLAVYVCIDDDDDEGGKS